MKTEVEFPSEQELFELLEDRFDLYNRKSFIKNDPICIPHRFSNREDIEIAGFLAATIAWGQRVSLIRNGLRLMELMDEAPADFVKNFRENDLDRFKGFVHRTFSEKHVRYFMRALQRIYTDAGGLERAFACDEPGVFAGIAAFRKRFLAEFDFVNASKHVANPESGSAAKRLNMYLRWMVRKDRRGVDFGLWTIFSPSELVCPLDVHSGGVARKLGVLSRTQNDRKAAEELTAALKRFDPADPVKYDYALFGLGINENFRKIIV